MKTKYTFDELYNMEKGDELIVYTPFDRLFDVVITDKEAKDKKLKKTYFTELTKAFNENDLRLAYKIFNECLLIHEGECETNLQNKFKFCEVKLDKEQKLLTVQTGSDEFIELKCDKFDKQNLISTISIALTKLFLGYEAESDCFEEDFLKKI